MLLMRGAATLPTFVLLSLGLACSGSGKTGRGLDGAAPPADGPAPIADRPGPESSTPPADGSGDLLAPDLASGPDLRPSDLTGNPDTTAPDGAADVARDVAWDMGADLGSDFAPAEVAVDLVFLEDHPLLVPDAGIDGQTRDQRLAPDGPDARIDAGGESRANPCASCAANEICAQLNDGMCNATSGVKTVCRAVSDSCRSKLASSGQKNCRSFPECDAELCLQNYVCWIASPCGNEIPEAAVYCYGA